MTLVPDWSIAGEGDGDRFGESVASAGDTNGDGFALFCSDAGVCETTGASCGDVGDECASNDQCCSGLECASFPDLGSLCTPVTTLL